MTHALTLTFPMKQDADSQAKLKDLSDNFAVKFQPSIEAALRKSRLVHFARIVNVDNKYVQVITEYEGSHEEYNEFFRREAGPIFAAIFALTEGLPDVSNTNAFFDFSRKHNLRTLGNATDGSTDADGNPAGWLFSAYDNKTVDEIQAALAKA